MINFNQYIIDAIKESAEFRSAALSCKKQRSVQFTGVNDNAHAAFCAALGEETGKKLMVICDAEKDLYRIAAELEYYGKRAVIFPARDFVLDNIIGYSREWEHERLSALMQILNGDFDIILAVPDAVMQYTMPKQVLQSGSVELKTGKKISLTELCAKLVSLGYERAELVEGRGQFSARGGIVDVFSPHVECVVLMCASS